MMSDVQASQSHQQCIYNTQYVLSDQIYNHEEKLKVIDRMILASMLRSSRGLECTPAALAAFIPLLLSKIRVECLIHGNTTVAVCNHDLSLPQLTSVIKEALKISRSVVDKIVSTCSSRPFPERELSRRRLFQLVPGQCP